MGNFTSKLTSLATLSIQDGTPQSKIQHGSSTTGLEDPPQGEWIAVHHPELDRNNNKMENKVSAAQSASKASAPLGPITQAAIKAYKAKQQENSSAALKLKKEKKPTPEPGLYAYKVHSANFEHGFTRFGVKNITNNNKNNKVKPGTKTNSTNHKGNKYSNKPFARPNGKPTNKPRFQRSFPNQKPLQQPKGTYNHKGNIYNENNLSKPHFLCKTHHFHGGKSVFSKSIHPASFGKDKVKISLYQHNSMRKERLMQSKRDK